jgi:AraC-like DNA-binding protein
MLRRMDALASLLDGPRARGAFLLRSVMSPPWCLRVQDEAPLTLAAVITGHAWLTPTAGDPLHLGPGDVAVLKGPDPYTVADDPATPVHTVIHPGQRCTTLRGEPLGDLLGLGIRAWGNDADGGTVLLTGTYQMDGEVTRRLLDALPTTLVVPAADQPCPYLGLMATEMARDEPGQEAVLDRLLDLLLIAVLREWFSWKETDTPAWYKAHADPVVGRALRLLTDDPARPWTVAQLAARCGVSRAALARRFTDLVGEPPMAYLTGWRLALAADLLREPGATVGQVARKVGYGSPFALSTAFKRVYGISPQQHRTQAA